MAFPWTGLQPGQRIAVFGRAGVGKSHWTKWAVLRSNALRWIILDTKHDPIWDDLPIIDHLPSAGEMSKAWAVNTIIVTRPTPSETNEGILDLWLEMIHERFNRFGIVIDEGYQVCYGTNAGPGLAGLLTRGRVRGQAVIVGSQRPAYISQFVFTEASGYCIMSLLTKRDRDKVADMVAAQYNAQVHATIRPRHWLWYDTNQAKLTPMRPVTILPCPVIIEKGEERAA